MEQEINRDKTSPQDDTVLANDLRLYYSPVIDDTAILWRLKWNVLGDELRKSFMGHSKDKPVKRVEKDNEENNE